MPSGHKKDAIKNLRRRYSDAWSVKIIPVGIELQREISVDLTQHIFFNFVRDDMLGLRVQPGLAVRFPAVNMARDAISPRHQYTVDSMTGFVFLNDLIEPAHRQYGGWFFAADGLLQPDFEHFLDFVDETVKGCGFFEALQTLEDYISVREARRWAFYTGDLPYLYALIAVGQTSKAKKLATAHRAMSIQIGHERGFVQRESNTQPYDEILRIAD